MPDGPPTLSGALVRSLSGTAIVGGDEVVVAPIAVAILIGLVAGALRRGRLVSLTRTRLRRPLLLAIAVICALAADVLDVPSPAIFAFVGLLAGIAFAGSNLLIPGMVVVGIGVAVNLLPVALNGAMPVRADALVDAGIVAEADLDRVVLRGARELADSETSLEILGDVIPVPQVDQVMSFGDLIVLIGLTDVIANLMRVRRPLRLPRGARSSLEALGWDHASRRRHLHRPARQPRRISQSTPRPGQARSPDTRWSAHEPPSALSRHHTGSRRSIDTGSGFGVGFQRNRQPVTDEDPVLARRARVAALARAGQRGGYILYGAALVTFFYGLIAGFSSGVSAVVVTALVVGSVLLAPAIIAGYAVKAADRADRDAGW